jgi:hypothetical protein
VVDPALTQVMLGWLLNWANCPDRGLNSAKRAEAAHARRAAAEGVSVLSAATQESLTAALDEALDRFPVLCPDVPEERRLRMAARLARILASDRSLLIAQLPTTSEGEG